MPSWKMSLSLALIWRSKTWSYPSNSDAWNIGFEMIHASQTMSQRLVEAHQKNLPTEVAVPKYLQCFMDVFSKESFDALLNQKLWDHAIDLKPGSKPSNCKVYPLSTNEQSELDAFLQENLKSGCIQPSKSLWPPLSSSSKRRMAPYDWYRTTEP